MVNINPQLSRALTTLESAIQKVFQAPLDNLTIPQAMILIKRMKQIRDITDKLDSEWR